MGSGTACGPARDAPSSGGGVSKDASVSPRRRRPYVSLRGRRAFQRVFRSGRRRRAGGVVVIVAPGDPGLPRVGVVAGKRDVGGAVQRNRAKRRLREALIGVPLRDGHDYVVIASRRVLTEPFGGVRAWLRGAVEKESASG